MTQDVAPAVVSCLKANRANTLPMLACLRACDLVERPYREVEAELAGQPVMNMSTQTPHMLIALLLDAGGIEAVDAAPEPAAASLPEPLDQPTDYLLRITDAGRAALAAFDPERRFAQLLSTEPVTYRDAYAQVLSTCDNNGASRAAVEAALAAHPALEHPKRIYPAYFISKLETIGGLSWNGAWRTTDAGKRMRAALAAAR